MRRLAALALAAAGCLSPSRAAERPPPDAQPKAPPSDTGAPMTKTEGSTTYDFSLTREGNSLKLSYWVENGSDKTLYVCDKLVTQGSRPNTYAAVDRVTVQNTDQPHTVMLVAGTPATSVPSYRILPQVYRGLAPKERFNRAVTIPLPLKAWNPMGHEKPLKKANQAVLLIFTFEGEPPRWSELPGEDGTAIKVPEGMSLKVLRGGPVPIPS
jgi:hypothetical protein